jgi:hypothetical protein
MGAERMRSRRGLAELGDAGVAAARLGNVELRHGVGVFGSLFHFGHATRNPHRSRRHPSVCHASRSLNCRGDRTDDLTEILRLVFRPGESPTATKGHISQKKAGEINFIVYSNSWWLKVGL